jgi:DNA polymerase III delta prime subunit
MFLLSFLKGFSLKDGIYAAIIIALISGFIWYSHHERVIGAHKEVALVARIEKQQQKRVDAINAKNKKIEDAANEKIKVLSNSLIIADANLTSRLHHYTRSHRSIIVPEASCPSVQSPVISTTQSGTKTSGNANKRVAIDTAALKDDLNIALMHNEQLQEIIREFSQIKRGTH